MQGPDNLTEISAGPVSGHDHREDMKIVPRAALAPMLCLMVGFTALTGSPVQARGASVDFAAGVAPGTIIIRTGERQLYLVTGEGRALRYSVGVGRAERQWTGETAIEGKFVRPNWAPPAAILKDNPALPALIPGGAPNNPMGAAAMTLTGGVYAIHGTNVPSSIGGFVSYGCIRMLNGDILDLFARVGVGTRVLVED
jgi:lipoprotein-anchoring transpeptidase ErfK/SrfK